jgi:hypothetical protein
VVSVPSLTELIERTVSVKDYLAQTTSRFRETADERLSMQSLTVFSLRVHP